MKKILFIILFFLISTSLSAAVYNSVYSAMTEARQSNKFIVFMIVSNDCSHCHELINNLRENKAMFQYMQRNFVIAVADISSGGKVPSDLPFNGTTPTIMVISLDGKVVGEPIEGVVPLDMFKNYLDGILKFKNAVERSMTHRQMG